MKQISFAVYAQGENENDFEHIHISNYYDSYYRPPHTDQNQYISHIFTPSSTILSIAEDLAKSTLDQGLVGRRNHPLLQILLDALIDEGCLTVEQIKNFR